MPSTWKPDTCSCKLCYDNDFNIIESKSIKCPNHSELDTVTELIPFVIAENQSANELYVNWTPEEIDSNLDLIDNYKKAFKEGKIVEPIRDLTPANARLAFQSRLDLANSKV
jgi:hypothetical protein